MTKFIESVVERRLTMDLIYRTGRKTNVSRRMIHESEGRGRREKLVINGAVCSAYQRGVLMFVISGNNFTGTISTRGTQPVPGI